MSLEVEEDFCATAKIDRLSNCTEIDRQTPDYQLPEALDKFSIHHDAKSRSARA